MHIMFRDRKTGYVTMAVFRRHTMSRTIRRYPSKAYEMRGGDLSGTPVRLAGGKMRPYSQ